MSFVRRFTVIRKTMLYSLLLIQGCLQYGSTTSTLLSMPFEYEASPLQDTMLQLFHTRQDTRSPMHCAYSCFQRRTTSPSCIAFDFNPLDRTCDLYEMGTVLVESSSIRVSQYQMMDVWHSVSVGENAVFSIYFSSEVKTFFEARSHCNQLGGYLIQFDSLEEYQAVNTVRSGSTYEHLLVGFNDLATEGVWVKDADNTTVKVDMLLWRSDEPDDLPFEHCASISNGVLADVDCDRGKRFLCERDTISIP